MSLTDQVRATAREIAASARHVRIDVERLAELDPGPPPALDAERHYLEGTPEEVAHFMLVLDSINFGSGWFPTLRKRPGHVGVLHGRVVADRLLAVLRWVVGGRTTGIDARGRRGGAGQDPSHELMALYAEALRDLGRFLGTRRSIDLVAAAERLGRAARLDARGRNALLRRRGLLEARPDRAERPRPRRRGRVRRPGPAHDLRRQPRPPRSPRGWRAVYDPALAARIDAGELLEPGGEEREIRGCAVHACELLSERLGVPARQIDTALWSRGQGPDYKAVPRHRTRTVFY